MPDEKLYYQDGRVLVEKKYYKTGCDEFEAAIKKFGLESALEYFATPEEEKHNFEHLSKG